MRFSVKGLKEVQKQFLKLDKNFDRNVVIPAIQQGLIILEIRAKANCKWPSLRELISKKTFISKRDRKAKGKVFLKPAKGRTIKLEGRDVGFEAVGMILEFGRKSGDLKPMPFMRPAMEQAGKEVHDKIGVEIKRHVEEMVRKK